MSPLNESRKMMIKQKLEKGQLVLTLVECVATLLTMIKCRKEDKPKKLVGVVRETSRQNTASTNSFLSGTHDEILI